MGKKKKNKPSNDPAVVEARKRNRQRRESETRMQFQSFVDSQIDYEDRR